MSEAITTTELLQFLARAHKVSSYVNVVEKDDAYKITVYCDWEDDDHHYGLSVCISEEECFSWENADLDFYTMDNKLSELVEIEEEREIKRQKRQELLSRLTDEEKELLGVK